MTGASLRDRRNGRRGSSGKGGLDRAGDLLGWDRCLLRNEEGRGDVKRASRTDDMAERRDVMDGAREPRGR
jgi:hypothetical protein